MSQPRPPDVPMRSLAARTTGVLRTPRATFASVAADPRWAGILALTVAVAAGASLALSATAVGQQALLDQRVDLLEGFGQTVDDEHYAELEANVRGLALLPLANAVVGIPLLTMAVAGLSRIIYRMPRGGTVTMRQALAVVAHAGAVLLVRALVLAPWNYVRESLGSPLNASALFPALDEGSFLSAFLGSIDLFLVWWGVLLAIGLSVLYRRPTRSVAVTVFSAYGAIAIALAGAKSALGGQ